MSGATASYKCKWCGDPFEARTADRARGWARFCSKTCKAKKQEKRTGQHAKHLRSKNNYLGSGVSRETYMHHQREHGGTPNFDRQGNYVGFQSEGFSNE